MNGRRQLASEDARQLQQQSFTDCTAGGSSHHAVPRRHCRLALWSTSAAAGPSTGRDFRLPHLFSEPLRSQGALTPLLITAGCLGFRSAGDYPPSTFFAPCRFSIALPFRLRSLCGRDFFIRRKNILRINGSTAEAENFPESYRRVRRPMAVGCRPSASSDGVFPTRRS